MRHRNGGGGRNGHENMITLYGNENDQDDMDDPVNRPLGWRRTREHHPSPHHHHGGGGGGEKENDHHGLDDFSAHEDENNDGGVRYPQNFLPRTSTGEIAIIFKDGREISFNNFQEETCQLNGLKNLKSFGLKDPNVGAIHWGGTISLRDEDGELINLSKVIKFHTEGVVVWRDLQNNFSEGYPVPARGRGLNKPCVVEYYGDANENPEENDGTKFFFFNHCSFFDFYDFQRFILLTKTFFLFHLVTGPEQMEDQVRDLPGKLKISLLYMFFYFNIFGYVNSICILTNK